MHLSVTILWCYPEVESWHTNSFLLLQSEEAIRMRIEIFLPHKDKEVELPWLSLGVRVLQFRHCVQHRDRKGDTLQTDVVQTDIHRRLIVLELQMDFVWTCVVLHPPSPLPACTVCHWKVHVSFKGGFGKKNSWLMQKKHTQTKSHKLFHTASVHIR